MAALETASNADICKQKFQLDLDTINPHLRKVQYAVRGPVLDRAMEIERDLMQVKREFLAVDIISHHFNHHSYRTTISVSKNYLC